LKKFAKFTTVTYHARCEKYAMEEREKELIEQAKHAFDGANYTWKKQDNILSTIKRDN
jgi:hypothetical protein